MSTNKILEDYVPISLKDIKEDEILPFDIYLHLEVNNKIIAYLKKNTKFETQKKDSMAAKVEFLYIREEEKDLYYQFMSNRFVDVLNRNDIDEDERKIQVKAVAGNLLKDVFLKEKEGVQLESNIQSIVKEIITEIADESMAKIYEKLIKVISSETTTFSHSINVTSYSVMFAFCLGLTNSKELSNLSIAAILHDIYLASLRPELVEKYRNGEELNMVETLKIHNHVLGAEDIIKARFKKFSAQILWIIRQHHERPDGKGYPLGLRSENISLLAKVLSIANLFDNTVRSLKYSGKKEPHPKDVLIEMKKIWSEDNQLYEKSLFYEIVETIGLKSEIFD